MCGFVAIVQEKPIVDTCDALRALDSLDHRGPDASGHFVDGHVFLGHRRLSIIDLETGDQPMFSHDGRYVVVYNGEIYNFPELREELSGNGAHFDTQSDTEVILEGYKRWGKGVVQRLNGMFAFVVWDRREQVVFGARDRLGIKPFCWATVDGALIAASTLEPFATLGEFRTIDPIAVRDAMTFDYIPSPRTIFEGVSKLDPGSTLEWSFGQAEPRIERYWSPGAARDDARPLEDGELERLLEEAVSRQMISDVPVGAFLSGGIDSSLLVALMSRHSSGPVETFSVSFPHDQVDESAIALKVAETFGARHTIIPAEEVDSPGLLRLLGRLDEPFCDPAYIPTFALSEVTRKHVKVALSGDGGDEVFGGYPRYLLGSEEPRRFSVLPVVDRVLGAVQWRPRGMARLYYKTLSPAEKVRFSWARYGNFPIFRKDLVQLLAAGYRESAAIESFFEPWEVRAERYGTDLNMDVLMKADLETYLSENCLVKTDRASMQASLEVRVPYLDEIVLDRLLPLPAEHKIVDGGLKALLLPLASRLLPREVWDRPKHGFDVPFNHDFGRDWRPALEEALDWGEANLRVFNYDYLRRLHARNMRHADAGRDLWNPFVFIAWCMERSLKL